MTHTQHRRDPLEERKAQKREQEAAEIYRLAEGDTARLGDARRWFLKRWGVEYTDVQVKDNVRQK